MSRRRKFFKTAQQRPRLRPGQQCHDCAFALGSQERADAAHPKWRGMLANMRGFVAGECGPQPFYCHFTEEGAEMPADESGAYCPTRQEDGAPIGFRICSGWFEATRKLAQVRRKRGQAVGEVAAALFLEDVER